MRPPKFHVGQAVVCTTRSWVDMPSDAVAPRRGPIYTVEEVVFGRANAWHFWKPTRCYIRLAEMPQYRWDAKGFAPVEELPAEALAELLEEAFTPVTAWNA